MIHILLCKNSAPCFPTLMSLIFITGKDLSSAKATGLGDGLRYISQPDSTEFIDLYDNLDASTSLSSVSSSQESRLYSPISSLGTSPPAPAPYLLIVQTEIKDSDEAKDEFHRWYEEEHIPLLSKVNGFIRARRFRLQAVNGNEKPNTYLALYEIHSPDFVKEQAFLDATSTPWMMDVGNKWVTSKSKGIWALKT
ncbi:hypothetical protein DL96DRAFT_247481 [Flagelloscypha sp. PMI_526]|nr:hypothetical protein DL96DRAFT_247481 [Flagelloscypha sp. PMI_526]